MNRALPPGDRGHRRRDYGWPSRYRGALPGAVGLVCGVADTHSQMTNTSEVNQNEREAVPTIGAPGRDQSGSRSCQSSVCSTEQERLRDSYANI